MDLLEQRSAGRSRWALLTTGVATVSLFGCALLEVLGPNDDPGFSHRRHMEQEVIACVDCHLSAEDANDPGMPSKKLCLLCHETEDEIRNPDTGTVLPFGDDGRVARKETGLAADVTFSHLNHVERSDDCITCHADVAESANAGRLVRMRMDACISCHETSGLETSCESCHAEINAGWQPANHGTNWKRAHGGIARRGGGGTVDDCSICHTDSSCLQCHLSETPSNHDNHWRMKGHGIAARVDRQNCAACHRADSCERCHQETAPLNHGASWGDPQDMHCLTCHFPLRTSGCITCHRSDSSHLSAPQPPPSVEAHLYSSTCVVCHQRVKPIQHPFTGDGPYCLLCHKP